MQRVERERCWAARDNFFKCLDSNNEEISPCKKLREEFEKNCPEVWVGHFEKKRRFEKFKEQLDENNWSIPKENVK